MKCVSTTAPPQNPTHADQDQAREPIESAEQALVPAPQALETALLVPPHTHVARLPVEVDVAIPIRDFRVRNLLTLHPGTVVESQWVHGEDMPLGSRDVQLAWSEFEVVDAHLAVRITRLV